MIAANGLSIAHGIPLADEPALGALTLPGFLREICGRNPTREALDVASPGELAVPQFPFLRRVVALDLVSGAGAIERRSDFIASGADVPDDAVAARPATVAPADPGVVFFLAEPTASPSGVLSAHRAVAI